MSSDDRDEVARAIQGLFRATPLLLVGSGFSCGYGMPGMHALGEHLCKNVDQRLSSDEAKGLWQLSLPAVQANLEAGLNTIASGAAGREALIAAIREETAALIIESTGKVEAEILSQSNPHRSAPVRLLKRLFNGAPQNAESISVITTNYDTLIELFCDLGDLPVDTGFSGHRRRKARQGNLFQTQYRRSVAPSKRGASYEHRPSMNVRVMKPHGSINWHATEFGPIEVLNDVSKSARAIVVPGPSKYEDALVNSLFDNMRTEMNACVGKATALMCLGFGFNDVHLQGTIQNRLSAGMPALIIARDFTDNIRSVLAQHPQAIGICSSALGSEVHYGQKKLEFSEPLWQLETFLTNYLE